MYWRETIIRPVRTHPLASPPDRSTLRIAVVTETFPPEVNGVAATIAVMVGHLRGRGHDVQVVRPRQKTDAAHPEPPEGTTLVRGVPIPGYSSLRMGLPSARLLARLWRAHRPDVVQVVTEGPLGWSAVRAALALRIPVVSDFHTNFHAYSRDYGAGWLMRPIAAYLRHLHNRTLVTMVPTQELRECLYAYGFHNVAVVSRGVDTTHFTPARRSEALRASWGAGPDTPVVVHVSRLAAEKNLDLLFRAFDAMKALDPRTRLVVVGDGPERERLERCYPGHVFAGMQRGASLAEHYASGDVFLYPSLSETFGNVTVEAMASGLAVVAYDYAAAREHVRHDLNGMVAPFDDAAAFVAHACTLATDAARVARLRTAARATALTFDWERIIDALERELAQAARANAPTPPPAPLALEPRHGTRTP